MKNVRRLIAGGYLAMMGVILFLLLFVVDGLDFLLKRRFLLTYPQMLGAGMTTVLMILLPAYCIHRSRLRIQLSLPTSLTIELSCWGMVLLAQAAFCYFTYFLTGWDSETIVRNAFYLAKYGNPVFLESSYFSQYPNNVLIVEIFAMIIRAFCLVAGDPGMDRCVLILLFAQCALNAGTGFMLRRIAFRITHSLSFSIAVAAVYVGFVSFSPWVLIPYSDSMSLFVPVLCLYLYQKQQESSRKIPYWIGIGAVSAVGFLLKPQALILSIAIVIWETFRLLSRNSVCAWSARIGSMVLVLLIGVGPLNGMLREYTLLGVDTTKSVGMMHYFMMGMNPETRGTYSGPDFMDTIYMPPEERSSIQLQKGVERIREMGFGGFMELMRDKILINYTDGMFGWGIYGTFFQEMIEDKDDVISPFLKSVVYSSGKHYPSFATGRQCIWVALLMGCLLLPFACCAIRGTERQGVLMIMMLAVMGLTAFECIFEALSRYLYAYTPVYLLMGMLGLWYALAWFGNRFRPEQTEA